MRSVLPAAAALIPLIIAPGVLLYFDVTPKLTLLFVAAAAGLLSWRNGPGKSKPARFLLFCFALEVLSLLLSTLLSTHPGLSWNGGNWRRFGLVPQYAVLAFAFLVLCDCGGSEERVRTYLKAIAAGAMPVALYAILQYFGIDPWLPAQSYHAGEDTWAIVRPPSTMGHASYLASYLLCVVFMAAALWRVERSRSGAALRQAAWRFVRGNFSQRDARRSAQGSPWARRWRMEAASVLSRPPRGVMRRRGVRRRPFYASPAGKGLRHRVTWSRTEPPEAYGPSYGATLSECPPRGSPRASVRKLS